MANSKAQQEGGQFLNKNESIIGELSYVEQEVSTKQKNNLKVNWQNEVVKNQTMWGKKILMTTNMTMRSNLKRTLEQNYYKRCWYTNKYWLWWHQSTTRSSRPCKILTNNWSNNKLGDFTNSTSSTNYPWMHLTRSQVTGWDQVEGLTKSSCGIKIW